MALAAVAVVLAIVGVILWVALSAATQYFVVKFGFLEEGVPNASGGTSPISVRIGPHLGGRAKRVLLAQKSLDLVSSFLVGMYPVEVAEVRIFRCKATCSVGLRKFLRAVFTGGELSGILAPKLLIRCKNVRIMLRGNGEDEWQLQKEAVEAGIENMNQSFANRLTELIDENMRRHAEGSAEGDDASPSSAPSQVSKLIDSIIKGLDIEVEGFHINWATQNFGPSSGQQGTPESRLSSVPASGHGGSKEWNIGMKLSYFSLGAAGAPTAESRGLSPRPMRVRHVDMYIDMSDTHSATPPQSSASGAIAAPVPSGTNAVVHHADDGDASEAHQPSLPELTVSGDHNTIVRFENMSALLMLPEIMSVLLAAGKQPQGYGKLMMLHLEQVGGVVINLEPFQVFGFMTNVIPTLSMSGKYNEWCTETQLVWHKEALARSPGIRNGGVPQGGEELQQYAEALGSKKIKRDDAKLRKLDKNMTLTQIMLTRMRVRKWEFARPEGVAKSAQPLLDAIDPFQGVPLGELTEEDLPTGATGGDQDSNAAGTGAAPGADGEGGEGRLNAGSPKRSSAEEVSVDGASSGDDKVPHYTPDEAAKSLSWQEALGKHEGEKECISLRTDSPEEAARLEALLYLSAQEWTHGNYKSSVLMEIDIRVHAKDVSTLIFHPNIKKLETKPNRSSIVKAAETARNKSKSVRSSTGHEGATDDEDSGSASDDSILSRERRQNRGLVRLGESEELDTATAIERRNEKELPALIAAITIQDFRFGFNMLMGTARAEGDTGDDDGYDLPDEEAPVVLHTFSSVLLPDAQPIQLYQPLRLAQGADLQIENFGTVVVGDGVPSMFMGLGMTGLRISDYGALEDGRVFPTIVDGPSAADAVSARPVSTAAVGSGDGGDGEDAAGNGGDEPTGDVHTTVAMYSGGRLEIGAHFTRMSVVALPDRMLAIVDVVLACVMGPPAARKAQEMNALEDEVEMEEEEAATGGRSGEVLRPSGRREALIAVQGAYLYFGRMDARFTVQVEDFNLLLPENPRDASTNVLMAQVPAFSADVQSGSAFEALSVDVGSFSIAPCVQGGDASEIASQCSRALHEMAVTVALKGPRPELLNVMRLGLPLKSLDLYPIPERRLILPVDMTLKYSTTVSFRSDHAPEAATTHLIGDMMADEKAGNDFFPADMRDTHGAHGTSAGGSEEENNDNGGEQKEKGQGKAAAERDDQATDVAIAPSRDDGGGPELSPASASGLYVESMIKLHVPSGLRIKVTDLDLSVLKGIVKSLTASLSTPVAAAPAGTTPADGSADTSGAVNATGGPVIFALDQAQRRTVAGLRKAFRRADVNGDGTLDRREIESLLRNHLKGQNLDVAEREAEVAQFIGILDEDGSDAIDLEEFTSTMLRLMTDGPDEATLERGRTQAVTKAFHEADTDSSGELCRGEIMDLLRKLDMHHTQSELETGVDLIMEKADEDHSKTVDLQEFLQFVRIMRTGDPHEGPITPKAAEYRSWSKIRNMLEKFDSLPELLADRPPDYSPPMFWEEFERETHATQHGSGGQVTEALQVKMVKTFQNYMFARDAWSLLVAPAWYPGLVRVGSLRLPGEGNGPARRTPYSRRPQLMPAPVRPGSLVYSQEGNNANHRFSSRSSISAMKIHRLPEELAPPPSGQHRNNVGNAEVSAEAAAEAAAAGFVTGIRLPAPANHRLSQRGTSVLPGVEMEIDRPCTLLVCFHDEAVTAAAAAGGGGGGASGGERSRTSERGSGVDGGAAAAAAAASSNQPLPQWAADLGLTKTGMKIETVLPGVNGGSSALHVFRVYSTRVLAGALKLGESRRGALPYIVLLHGGQLVKSNRNSRRFSGRGLRGRLRRYTNHSSAYQDGVRRANAHSSGLSRASTAGSVSVSSVQSLASGGGVEGQESIRGTDGLGLTPSLRSSTRSGVGSGSPTVDADGELSWKLEPDYQLGEAGRGLSSITKVVDKEAGNAARTALKVAALSAIGGQGKGDASPGGGEVTKRPRLRFKVTMLVEQGVFLQMEDIHRLQNSGGDHVADPTVELAFLLPLPGQNGDATAGLRKSKKIDPDHGAGPKAGGKGGGTAGSGVTFVEVDCPQEGCDGEVVTQEGPEADDNSGPAYVCCKCNRAAPAAKRGERSSDAVRLAEDIPGLLAMLDFEHVSSTPVLGSEDSLSMRAAFGVEGKYLNPRVQRSEHFLEPWSMSINASDPRGSSNLRGELKAERHLVLNATTGLATLVGTIVETRNHYLKRYSSTSVYTELRGRKRDDDDGSRLLAIENHLGVAATVTLEENSGEESPTEKYLRRRKAKESNSPEQLPATGNSVTVEASPYSAPVKPKATNGSAAMIGTYADRISSAELEIPDAKKSLPTATVMVQVEGFAPVKAVPLDLLGRGTHVFKLSRVETSSGSRWRYEGLVVRFVSRSTRSPSVLDMTMQLQTNVFLKNDMPRPLRVILGSDTGPTKHEPHMLMSVDEEVCLPLPILHSGQFKFWRSPNCLVGGEALRLALEEAEAEMKKRKKEKNASGSGGLGGGSGGEGFEIAGVLGGQEEEGGHVDLPKEVTVPLTCTTFDRKAKVVERHSNSMLVNGVSVERTDLAPDPGLIMHDVGDKSPALWRLYVRAPYVVHNGLASDVVLWCSQPAAEGEHDEHGDAMVAPPLGGTGKRKGEGGRGANSKRSLKRRVTLSSISGRKDHSAGRDQSPSPVGSTSSKPWQLSSNAPRSKSFMDVMHTPQRRSRGGGGSGGNESSSDINDDDDDDVDDESSDDTSESDSDISMEDGQYFEAKQGVDTGEKQEKRVLWLLKSGEEAKLEGMDLSRPLYVRVGFAPVDDYQNVREWSDPYRIAGFLHTNRTRLNKLASIDAAFPRADVLPGPGGARRPQFRFGVKWDHTPANRHLHIYSKVWVVNKTGVSLAYRAMEESKEKTRRENEEVNLRRPSGASYRTDADSVRFSSYATRGEVGLPLMLNCPASKLQAMPYAMADAAVDAPLYLSETRSVRSKEHLLPCAAFDGDGGGGDDMGWSPIYCDYPEAKVRLPREIAPAGERRVHMLTARVDATVEETFSKEFMQTIRGAANTPFMSFVPSRDCRVFLGLDKRLLALDPGPPKWLGLQGFARCTKGGLAEDVQSSPAGLAPEGFALFSRFCRGLTVVPMGLNVDHDGDAAEPKKGQAAAMYFIVVVEVGEEEAAREVDIGPISMHRSVGKIFDFHPHHRWRLKPGFSAGDCLYYDRDVTYAVTSVPDALKSKNLMHILTAQSDKRCGGKNMASFQVLQKSKVLVCYDSRADKLPAWISKRGFTRQEGLFFSAAPEGSGYGYQVFAKHYPAGSEVRLGGNKSKAAKRMYFCLVYSTVSQHRCRPSTPPSGPISTAAAGPMSTTKPTASSSSSSSSSSPTPTERAPPEASPKSERSPAAVISAGVGDVVAKPSQRPVGPEDDDNDGGGRNKNVHAQGGGPEGDAGGVVAATHKRDQVFRFWQEETNGQLVQAQLDLDWEGRGWCKEFDTGAVGTTGQAKSPAGVFGVTVEALSGAFLKTHVVTVWPRFVVRNNLGRKVGLLPTLEKPPEHGHDWGQHGTRATEADRAHGQRAAKCPAQAAPDSSCVILYDFTDPEDFDLVDEGESDTKNKNNSSSDSSRTTSRKQGGARAGGAAPRRLWHRDSKRNKEGKVPCVRLLSSRGKNAEESLSGEGQAEWAEQPTVAVPLESMAQDTYIWLDGGDAQEDVLVRVSHRILSNRATIFVELLDETPSPPLRVENRSATRTIAYRIGGAKESNVLILEPMRWTALHWINDDKRYIDAGVIVDEDNDSFNAKSLLRKGRQALKRIRTMGDGGDDSDSDSTSSEGGHFESKRYVADTVGRLKDLKVGGVLLQAECLRPEDSVTTTVFAFSDATKGAYGWGANSEESSARSKDDSARALDVSKDEPHEDEEEGKDKENEDALGMLARLWTGVHFEMRLEGLMLNIIHSTPDGPSELATFSVDGVEVGKPSGNPRVAISVWHFQLDDMRADSPHPIILAPLGSGFNSHLTKFHLDGLKAAPSLKIEVENDIQVSLLHQMTVMRTIDVYITKIRCAVYVDFWIDVQDMVVASLNWLTTSAAHARQLALTGAQREVGKSIEVPATNARADRIFVESYRHAELQVDVDFHLGSKVLSLLSSGPPADGEEKDEGGFGSSLALMPLGAAGSILLGLLGSLGASVANTSPSFRFDELQLERYNGTFYQAVDMLVMVFTRQGINQAYKVLGHIDILGDPISLGKSISSGVLGFVTKAGAGHIGEGSRDLVKGVVGGAASSASKITDALDNFVRGAGHLDGDSPSQGASMEKAPEHVVEGLTQGVKYFGTTLEMGIKGVVSKPRQGAKKDGAIGFVKGVGRGVLGLVAAPVSGALGATSKLAASIDATTRLMDDAAMSRRREPRHPLGGGERDDLDKLKKEKAKKASKASKLRQKRAEKVDGSSKHKEASPDHQELNGITEGMEEHAGEEVSSPGEGSGGDGGAKQRGSSPNEQQQRQQEGIDLFAEAGGMGLMLLPLTPEDMRANYPPDYIERCGEDAASNAGAVSEANVAERTAEEKRRNEQQEQQQHQQQQEEKDGKPSSRSTSPRKGDDTKGSKSKKKSGPSK